MPLKLTPLMRKTLEELSRYENILYRGSTAGEVEQGGGSRHCLYKAVGAGWVNTYPEKKDGAPAYYLRDEGAKVLEENTIGDSTMNNEEQ